MKYGSITTAIIADGLIFNIDPANRASYPKTGTIITDTIGNITGTLNGASGDNNTPQWENINGGIFDFDGSDDYIILSLDGTGGASSNFNSGTDLEFTISFWFNRGSSSIRIGLFQWSNTLTSLSPFLLIQQNNDNLSAYYDGGYRSIASTSQDIWYHITITRTASDNTLRGYLNGSELLSYDDGGTPILQNTTTSVYFGNGYQNYFNGNIANSQIYNRALSANEVLHNYNALKSRFGL